MRQLDLLNPGPAARASDPDTSAAAANRRPASRIKDRTEVFLAHIQHPEGLTDFELASLLNRQQTSLGKRRGELRDLGTIYFT